MSKLAAHSVIAFGIVVAASTTVDGQDTHRVDTTKATQPALLQPVDQGYADNNALQSSLRTMTTDMRAPSNWDRVYRVNSNLELYPGMKRAGNMLARASGGVIAVFPQSSYVPVGPGLSLATVPPGTYYTLGDANALTRPQFSQTRSPYSPPSLLVNAVANETLLNQTLDDTPRLTVDARTIWTSDNFRQQRIATLLDRATSSQAR